MRIPQSPPDPYEVLRRCGEDVFKAWEDDAYTSLIRVAQSKYLHWDKLRFRARQANLDPELVWAAVKLARGSLLRRTPLLARSSAPVQFTVTDEGQRELMLIDQELAGLVMSADDRAVTEHDRDRFILSAFRQEAIASSMIEGAVTTVRIAQRMLREGRNPRTHGERMVANNYKAILFIRESRKLALTPELLLELQTILTKDTLERPNETGRLRKASDDVQIVDPYGEIMHTPPPAEELTHRMDRLCSFANQQSTDDLFIHPVVRACLLHFQIGFDHPFCDGNGRTARAVFYWSMLRHGYWLFEYLPISKYIYGSRTKYGRAYLYTETDEFDATYFVLYNLRAISRARADLREHLLRKHEEMTRARNLLQNEAGLNYRQQALLMHAVRHPDQIYLIEAHMNSHGIAYPTARSDLLDLENRGLLSKKKNGNRFEFFRGPRFAEVESRLRNRII